MKTGTGSAISCTVAWDESQFLAVPVPVFISPRQGQSVGCGAVWGAWAIFVQAVGAFCVMSALGVTDITHSRTIFGQAVRRYQSAARPRVRLGAGHLSRAGSTTVARSAVAFWPISAFSAGPAAVP